jgi:hypothetical protein
MSNSPPDLLSKGDWKGFLIVLLACAGFFGLIGFVYGLITRKNPFKTALSFAIRILDGL